MFPKLNIKNFDSVVSEKNHYSCVLFTTKNCPPCEHLKSTIISIEDDYEEVKFYTFDINQLGAKELLSKQRVNFVPRMVTYIDGKDVGRFLWANYPLEYYQRCLEFLLDQLIETGRFLTAKSDVDEICLFRNRVMESMNWDGRGKNRIEKAEKMTTIADWIVDRDRNWGHMEKAQLDLLVSECIKKIDAGEIEIEASEVT